MPLAELCGAFVKTLSNQDTLLKKHQDELNAQKLKLQMLQKKEGGNLTVRDYTDDVYNKPSIGAAQFIEGMREGIVQFTNLLCVVPRAKY
jgi:hypothetical protein